MPGGPAKSAAKSRPSKENKAGTSDEPGRRATPSTCRVACRRSFRQIVRTIARIVDHGVRAFHVIMKIIGPCFICLALGLIGFCTHTYFNHLLPAVKEQWGMFRSVAVTLLGMYLLSNTLYNYFKAVTTDPGLPPEYDEVALQAQAEELSQPPPKQCKHCSRLKPERCHHCSVCRRCVLKMDHHCPWINNCVGFGNYRHFTLFMLFLSMSCIFVVCSFFPVFYDGMFNARRDRRFNLPRSARSSVMTSFMISCSIVVALCILGGFHVYLVLTNQTTIEFQLNLLHRREARKNGEYFRNPYDMGRRRNFQQGCSGGKHFIAGKEPGCLFFFLFHTSFLQDSGEFSVEIGANPGMDKAWKSVGKGDKIGKYHADGCVVVRHHSPKPQ